MAPHHNRIRLFERHWLEKLTFISAPVFMVLWAMILPVVAWIAWDTASARFALPLMAAGVVIWTLAEYGLHRFVFHWEPEAAPLEHFVFIMHGNHHTVPNDPLRNLMPPIVSLPFGGLIWAGMVGVLGSSGSWLFLGFIGDYVAYDLLHYACHQWPMKGRLARMLKTHHMRHHHLHEAGNFAITGMLWDRVFGTRMRRDVDA